MDKPIYERGLFRAIDPTERVLVRQIEDVVLQDLVLVRLVILKVLGKIENLPDIDIEAQMERLHAAILKSVREGEAELLRSFLEIQCAEFQRAFCGGGMVM